VLAEEASTSVNDGIAQFAIKALKPPHSLRISGSYERTLRS